MASTRIDNGKARTAYKLDAVSRAATIQFELRDQDWRISADPDVEVVATMLRLEREIRGLEDGDEETEGRDIAESIVEAKELILDLLEDISQKQKVERDSFRIGVGEILTLFALISGGPSVADAVAQGLTAGMSQSRSADDFDKDEEGARSGEQDEDVSPLASTKRSSARRSGRAASTNGRRRGGTA